MPASLIRAAVARAAVARAAVALSLSLAAGLALSAHSTAPAFALLYTSPYNGDSLPLDSGLSLTACRALQSSRGLLASPDSLSCIPTAN